MNPNKEIVVAGYLFTTNLEDETTTISPIKLGVKSSHFQLDKETTIRWDEDVFNMIETGKRQTSVKGYCGNTDRKKTWEDGKGNNGFYSRIQAKVCFQRAGWYNSIIIKFKLEKRESAGLVYDMHYKTENAWYHRRKRSKTNFSRENSMKNAAGSNNKISHRPYSSTRRVRAANIPVNFDYRGFNQITKKTIKSGSIKLTMSCT